MGWKGPRGRPLESGPGKVVLWLCAILMAVEMVVANGSFCFLFFGPVKRRNFRPNGNSLRYQLGYFRIPPAVVDNGVHVHDLTKVNIAGGNNETWRVTVKNVG